MCCSRRHTPLPNAACGLGLTRAANEPARGIIRRTHQSLPTLSTAAGSSSLAASRLQALKGTILTKDGKLRDHRPPYSTVRPPALFNAETPDEQKIALALTHNLAHAILSESTMHARGSIWGAGM